MSATVTILCKHCAASLGGGSTDMLVFETEELAIKYALKRGWVRSRHGDGWVCPDCQSTKQNY
jgi:hypothetical protein